MKVGRDEWREGEKEEGGEKGVGKEEVGEVGRG